MDRDRVFKARQGQVRSCFFDEPNNSRDSHGPISENIKENKLLVGTSENLVHRPKWEVGLAELWLYSNLSRTTNIAF